MWSLLIIVLTAWTGIVPIQPMSVGSVDDTWGVVGPEWRDISGRFVAPVIACRNEVLHVEASTCLDEMKPTLWLAHAERLSATIVMRLSMADAPAQVRPAMRAHSSRKPTVRWNN